MAELDALYHPPSNTIPVHRSSYDFISPSKHRGLLRGKTVVVTGAGRGIGRATALSFAAAGANVACISRTKSELDTLVGEIQSTYATTAVAIDGDVCDSQFVEKAVQQIQSELGTIDVLINNAGISRISDIEHDDVADAWKVIQSNMLGSMTFIHAVIPSMVQQRSGTIINVVSIIACVTLPYFAAYAASKAGMLQYTKVMDLELRPKGIKCFALHPCMCKETTLGRGAINEVAKARVSGIGEFIEPFLESNMDKTSLPADTMVALCTQPDAAALSGSFVDATYDLEEVLRRAKAGEQAAE